MGKFDPRTVTDEQLQKAVDSGKIDDFNRTDSGGIQTYQTMSNGDTLIKDVEPADNDKLHQQTDFTISGGYITDISPHND